MPADSTSAPTAATSNVWSWLTTLSPAVVALVTGIVTGGAGGYLLAPKPNPLPLGAADVPKSQERLPPSADLRELQTQAASITRQLGTLAADVGELKAIAAANWPRRASKLKAAAQ